MNNIELMKLKENTVHGDFILPFTTYHGEISESFSLIPIHWHEEIEISVIKSGKSEYKIDLNSYILEEGDLLIIKPLSLHAVNQRNKTTMYWSTIVFNLNMLNSAITDGCLIKYFAPILNNEHQLPIIIKKESTGYNELLTTLEKIFNCYNQKEIAFELELKSLLLYFFSILYKYNLIAINKSTNISNDVTIKIKNILNYIKKNYMYELSIKDVASACNFSEYHFMRFFKKHIGMTCIEYINIYRLEVASDLLYTTHKSIMDISFQVGFNNVSYFNKLFKAKYRLTPKEFRDIKKKA